MKNTLQQSRLFLVFFLLLLSITTTTAAIEVLKVVPISGCGASDGSITIIAEGTAGPFYITIEGPNGYLHKRSVHQGELEIFNLSDPGIYTYKIEMYGYDSGCAYNLSTSLTCLLPPEIVHTTGTSGTCPESSAGSIIIEGGTYSSQATFKWSGPNGFVANTKDISNLAAGDYYLLVKDLCSSGSWCQRTLHFYVDEIELDAKVSHICGGSGGAIDLEVTNGGNNNLTFEWSNNATSEDLVGVQAGEYCVTMTTPGCSMSLCRTVANLFEIEGPSMVKKACGTEKSGKISFRIKAEEVRQFDCNILESQYYRVSWNNQFKEVLANQDIVLQGFAAGENCFTVSGPYYRCPARGAVSCSVTKCFDMETYFLDVVGVNNLSICDSDGISSNCDGRIEMATDFSYLEWTGPNSYSDLVKVENGLASSTSLCRGNYVITGSIDGCSLSENVELCCCYVWDKDLGGENPLSPYLCVSVADETRIEITGEVVHNWVSQDEGEISISVTSTANSFNYKWSGPDGYHSQTKDIKNLKSGLYCVTVSDGCGKSGVECFRVYDGCSSEALSSLITIEQEPCVGLNDGIVRISIPNPNKIPYEFSFDGLLLATLIGDPADYTFENVSRGTHTIKVVFGDCVLSQDIEVESSSAVYDFQSYNKNKKECYYDVKCNDLTLEHQVQSAKVLNGWLDADPSLRTSCKIRYSCNGQASWDVTEGLVTDPVWIYNLKVLEFRANNLIPDYYIFPRQLSDMPLCRIVRYCPLNLDILFIGNGPFVTNGKSKESSDPNCRKRRCNLITKEYCAGDATSFLPTPPANPASCSIFDMRSAKLIEIQQAFLRGDFEGNENFAFSELRNLIVGNWYDNRSNCLTVYFCKNDFSVFATDISFVNCNPIEVSGDVIQTCEIISEYEGGEVTDVVYCRAGLFDDYTTVVLNLYDWKYLFAPQSNSLLVSGLNDEEFIGFSNYTLDGYTGVKGMVQTQETNKLYDFMMGKKESRILRRKEGLVFFSDDTDLGHQFRVYEAKSTNQYGLYYEGDSDRWMKFLDTDMSFGSLKLSYFKRDIDDIIVAGVYSGKLLLDGQVVSSASVETAFVLRVNMNGSVVSFNTIGGVDSDKGILFSEEDGNKLLVAGKSELNYLKYDEKDTTLVAPFCFVVSLEKNETFKIINTLFLNDESKVVDIAKSGMSEYSIALSNSTFIRSTSDILFQDSVMSFVIMNFESLGEMNWFDSYHQSSVDGGSFDMVYQGDTLLIGMTTKGDLDLDGHIISNSGQSDILIYKLVDGYSFDEKSFGSIANEKVSDVTFNEGIFYFAGTFSGDVKQRRIGAINVIDISPKTSNLNKAYMSYIEEELESEASSNKIKTTRKFFTEDQVTISPNPFDDSFTVTLSKSLSGQYAFEVLNTLGEKIISKSVVSLGGELELLIDFPYSSGVYMMKIQDEQGNIFAKKIIKQ